jgi:predicted Fe-Mo cluster-binding NifX family protein
MRVAVASRDGKTVSAHIGKCPHWIIFAITPSETDDADLDITEIERITLPKALIFHYYKDDRPHPLKACAAVIGKSSGESFQAKMQKRGIETVMTAEDNPAKAAADYARHTVVPPKPRPIGELICKIHDALSRHN